MRTGEAANRPSDWPLDILLKESVFLFYAIPWLLGDDIRVAEYHGGIVSFVERYWLAGWRVSVAGN
ncbi:hypothetical protein TorRG33x02_218250 [Trema orientale]|uniref:Uncharacterized protein n=1 Tax=Trema orientale TaxID=63057 RepID=A0A2P5EA20_TREOI|nr:hypothetical protein TorRG33x02_218250 [Trema orientale]